MERIRRRDRGLTLVETMSCIAIATALAAIAAANLRGGQDSIRLRSALVELQSHDHLMRDRARRWGDRGELVFNAETGRVTRVEPRREGPAQEIPLPEFADDVRVEKVLIAGDRDTDRDATRIVCSAAGRTNTYAALVAAGSERQWIVVTGLTGKFERIDDERRVADIFRMLGTLPAADGDDAR